MKKRLYRLLFALCAAAFSVLAASCSCSNESEDAVEEVFPMGFNPKVYSSESGQVLPGDTFPKLLMRYGLSREDANSLNYLCGDTFDVRKLRAEKPVCAYYSGDSLSRRLEYFVYENSRTRSTIFKCADSLCLWVYDKPVTHERKYADVTITTSLWNDMIASGASPLAIVELADIYAWTVNFFALQAGDRFRLLYDQTVCEDEVIAIDKVDYCIYTSGNFTAKAIRYDQGDKGNKYWNEKGESMKKAFLKAPLKYSRISSRFTYHRKHPVTGKVRPHTAVDYAAPKGTPVHTIGDGTVTMCGWDPSGGGNRIRIKHMNGYETCYMHLSGFAKGIKSGARVAQGQLIGYVGSTGTSTGPHLDFRVWHNGTPVDPLKMISPPAQPLKSQNMEAMKALLAQYEQEMEELSK